MSELPDMRASDSERERVAERLRDAVAEGRLTMEEFEERLEAAFLARTHGELEPLVRDLPAPSAAASGTAPVPTAGGGGWPERVGGPGTSRMAFAMWGGFSRHGGWTVPRRFDAVAVMGGGELDLREARFEDREVVIRCFTVMGGIQVIVPPDMTVDVTGFGFMGGFSESGLDAVPDPSAPRVRITGFALMGGVNVVRKQTRAERQRLKEEKQRLRAERKRNRLEGGRGREPGPDEEGGGAREEPR
ncbi:DUF1707 SHOCT-like domain-containing protein [Streptomyces clavuligerus]|uniref:DUF1707 domain-containing protein n=1 Tax=Streptomyces clavuligerus TaxID=1901 RepID=E2Q534_STRCL|nr:hypothetical protein BB341_18310 [Streptomyces clavuligerus]EFG07075.1 DUF1707 domain-containing protein [Streptomyces clavuligerus]